MDETTATEHRRGVPPLPQELAVALVVVLAFFVLLAFLAPRYGADTRESRQGILSRTPAPRPPGT
jgi:hypothetical protein